jgi:primosomal protein N''
MDQDMNNVEAERSLLVQCVEEAHESLRLIPGVDENGPALVWFADHLLQAHSRNTQPA